MNLFNWFRFRYGLFLTRASIFRFVHEIIFWLSIVLAFALIINTMIDNYNENLNIQLSLMSLQMKNQQAEKAIVNCLNGYFIAYYLDEHGKRHSIGCTIDEVGA